MNRFTTATWTAGTSLLLSLGLCAQQDYDAPAPIHRQELSKVRSQSLAKNVIFFVGDGMGVSTVTAARIFSQGVDGQLMIDRFPFTALSKTYTSDYITPDSAGTMSAMITGQNTNSGVISLDEKTERNDFNGDGDGKRLQTLLELAQARGMKIGVVTTARVTHATPAACYAHVNERNKENEIALQALPGDKTYNKALGKGLDLLIGGGRRFFVPSGVIDEEGDTGRRSDKRDLRSEFQKAGYKYVWNKRQFDKVKAADLPLLGLFDSSHMEYEYDRILDVAGEPSLADMTAKAVALLEAASKGKGYILVVESGRIDHAHHAGNAFRAMVETETFDRSVAAAVQRVSLEDTLILVTADHSHVFNIAGYPMRPKADLSYQVKKAPTEWIKGTHSGLFNLVYALDSSTGNVVPMTDKKGIPYTILAYANGGGYRASSGSRVDPMKDTFKGYGGVTVRGPNDPDYLQEAAVPLSSETHSGEDVAIYAIGPGAFLLNGTQKNTASYVLMKYALGL